MKPHLLLAWSLCLCQPLAAQQPPAAATGQVVVELVGLRSDDGQILAALFRSEAGFPSRIAKAFARKQARSKQRKLSLVFEGVPAGPFAVCMFHDENGNSAMEKSAFGIPKEGWGTSRDASATFGPPSFEDARLSLAPGERKHIVVHVRY